MYFVTLDAECNKTIIKQIVFVTLAAQCNKTPCNTRAFVTLAAECNRNLYQTNTFVTLAVECNKSPYKTSTFVTLTGWNKLPSTHPPDHVTLACPQGTLPAPPQRHWHLGIARTRIGEI